MFARTALRRSAHGGGSTTWVTSNGNPAHQYTAWLVAGLASGAFMLWSKAKMDAMGVEIKKKHAAAAAHHHGDHAAHH